MEQLEDLEQRVFAFQSRLGRFLGELEILAPLQRDLVEEAVAINDDMQHLRQARESAPQE